MPSSKRKISPSPIRATTSGGAPSGTGSIRGAGRAAMSGREAGPGYPSLVTGGVFGPPEGLPEPVCGILSQALA